MFDPQDGATVFLLASLENHNTLGGTISNNFGVWLPYASLKESIAWENPPLNHTKIMLGIPHFEIHKQRMALLARKCPESAVLH